VVAGGVDEGAGAREVIAGGCGGAFGEGEAGEAQVGVGLVEAEAAAGGEGEGFVEVFAGEVEGASVGVEGGAGKEAEGEVLLLAAAAEAVDGLLEVGDGLGGVGGAALDGDDMGATEGEVVEGGRKERIPCSEPCQCFRGTCPHVGIPVLLEQKIAIPEAANRIEQRISRLDLSHATRRSTEVTLRCFGECSMDESARSVGRIRGRHH
jgi:hypothetical protein